jgi:hypothetical protein
VADRQKPNGGQHSDNQKCQQPKLSVFRFRQTETSFTSFSANQRLPQWRG